jgi:hypothetical protein
MGPALISSAQDLVHHLVPQQPAQRPQDEIALIVEPHGAIVGVAHIVLGLDDRLIEAIFVGEHVGQLAQVPSEIQIPQLRLNEFLQQS